MKYFIIVILLLGFPPSLHANQSVLTKSTLLHDARHFQGSPHLTNVYFHTTIPIPYSSGTLVLSSTPDGTGPVTFFNAMHIYSTYPSSGDFEYAGTCQDREIPPIIISKFLSPGQFADYINLNIGYRKGQCGHAKKIDGTYHDYADIGTLYLVHFDDSKDTPTPFLRLPWDYEAAGLRFQDAALQINSYFDHEYPLLSNGLGERPAEIQQSIVKYNSPKRDFEQPYSSHDGYDWGAPAKAKLGDPVLAAADGVATYSYGRARGNAILIDHGNGYQTRYYHLLHDGLVTTGSTNVVQGQQIGLVGSTGNSYGAHIHFMVVRDKNGDGNFEDNIPDGIVDPFGWQSFEPDPWESYSFTYAGKERTGSRSYYLWSKKDSFHTSSTLGTDSKKVLLHKYTLDFPQNAVSADTILEVELLSPKQSNNLYSVGTAIRATVEDGLGKQITTFNKLWDLLVTFNKADIARFNPETLSIYSHKEGSDVWNIEKTVIDFLTGHARTSVDHMTEFALMGEKLDAIPPETEVNINGTADIASTYTSAVTLALSTLDKPTKDSLGIAYTLYKLNDADWKEYTIPFTLSDQGTYQLSYFSQDNDANIEAVKTLTFAINNSSPASSPTPNPQVTSTPTPMSTVLSAPTKTAPSQTITYRNRPFSSPTPSHAKKHPRPTHPTTKPSRVLGAYDVQTQPNTHSLSLLHKIYGGVILAFILGGGIWWKLRKR